MGRRIGMKKRMGMKRMTIIKPQQPGHICFAFQE